MSECNLITINQLAQEIYIEMGQPEDISIPYISSWFRYNIGNLNNLIGECYSLDPSTKEITPSLTNDSKDIFKQLWYLKYYEGQLRKTLSGVAGYGVTADDWTEIREGDSVVKRTNKAEIVRGYREILRDTQALLDKLVRSYRSNNSLPHDVSGTDVIESAEYSPYYNPRYRDY